MELFLIRNLHCYNTLFFKLLMTWEYDSIPGGKCGNQLHVPTKFNIPDSSKFQAAVLLIMLGSVSAFKGFQDRIPNGDRVPHPCKPNFLWYGVGHKNIDGGGSRNPFGTDFATNSFVSKLLYADSLLLLNFYPFSVAFILLILVYVMLRGDRRIFFLCKGVSYALAFRSIHSVSRIYEGNLRKVVALVRKTMLRYDPSRKMLDVHIVYYMHIHMHIVYKKIHHNGRKRMIQHSILV